MSLDAVAGVVDEGNPDSIVMLAIQREILAYDAAYVKAAMVTSVRAGSGHGTELASYVARVRGFALDAALMNQLPSSLTIT